MPVWFGFSTLWTLLQHDVWHLSPSAQCVCHCAGHRPLRLHAQPHLLLLPIQVGRGSLWGQWSGWLKNVNEKLGTNTGSAKTDSMRANQSEIIWQFEQAMQDSVTACQNSFKITQVIRSWYVLTAAIMIQIYGALRCRGAKVAVCSQTRRKCCRNKGEAIKRYCQY